MRSGDKDAGEDDSEEEFHRDKNHVAMEELKEVDMNYLINEDSDADDMYQNSASKKKKNTLLGKAKEIDEVTFKPFASPYIEAEQRHIGD